MTQPHPAQIPSPRPPASDPQDGLRFEEFRCDVRAEREVVRVVAAGEIDLSTVPRVDAVMRELCEAGWRHIVLDLTEVSFLDSTGVHLVLTWARHAESDGIALTVVPGPPSVQRVFELTGLLDRLPFARDGRGPDAPEH